MVFGLIVVLKIETRLADANKHYFLRFIFPSVAFNALYSCTQFISRRN